MAKGQFRMLRSAAAGIDAVEAETRHSFARHTHDQFGIGLIYRGAQKSLSGRGMVEAGAGDMITVNPGEVHDGAPIGDTGRAWRMLYLDPSVISAAAEDISQGRSTAAEFTAPAFHDAEAANQFRALFAAITATTTPDEAIRREERLLTLLGSLLATGKAQRSESPAAVASAKTMIDDDPTAAITLADLAAEAKLSRFQLVRNFARDVGLTPHAYIVQRRIDLARDLIGKGTPLAEAAIAAGFADQSHMTRVFVSKYGLSPGAYSNASK
ncbi:MULTISPECIES: AraC family transcriptional regulator [unclassified Ensifer]|uniref:AraC family transcriptional regulator n=1 Tax=unclassified Ensifer TaxID=2633371 RepID=UPI0008138A50|nr:MULTISPECIES: AraC family transcriptional regulator [unclassified Ensifer]OCP07573.1 AraC family transcriptional regulator [Ensifer sp. LC11]OCP07656.1 AraC family transcriptional regulator [Ensifer sp. LC14]OCP08325.1 AraC family transcriptional regulator [Ensifer sp. LC13]OCP32045.1 AraC family transcriptional regulator [Ensifer sp. LC499]